MDELLSCDLEMDEDEDFDFDEDLEEMEDMQVLSLTIYGHHVRSCMKERNVLSMAALPIPIESPWAHLVRGGDDPCFIAATGLDKVGFYNLLEKFRHYYTHRYHLGRGGRPSKVDTAQALGIVLQFYRSPIEQSNLGQLHGCRANTLSRILDKAEKALQKALQKEELASVTWPSIQKQREW
jgi:hypothetical protein